MNGISFSRMADELSKRASRASLGLLSPANEDLRRFLAERFNAPLGREGSFLSDPVCEPMFPWMPANETLADLAGNLLHPRTVDALHAGTFLKTTNPYVHQVHAWRMLLEKKRSVVVTSGTGSGKTECFLVPILDDLAREAATTGRLKGVRALFLYPLNALIASQHERLSNWTRDFSGDVRFALYNGNTPDSLPDSELKAHPQEALDRKTIRKNPPPILVTNSTMLEYALVRQQDRPILDASQGKLRWIVLDEAHTYLGSQAAELALLLRRVMSAFGVDSKDVRLVATSATIGKDEKSQSDLRQFLADLGGLEPEHVEVVDGKRRIPPIPEQTKDARLDEVRTKVGEEAFFALTQHTAARRVRDALTKSENGALRLSQVVKHAGLHRPEEALELLDVCHATRRGDEAFLPLRIHFFHRTLVGAWTCINPKCAGKSSSSAWPYGALFGERRLRCPSCQSLVYDVVLCARCGEPHLQGLVEDADGQGTRLVPDARVNELEEDVGGESPEADDDDEVAQLMPDEPRLFHAPASFIPSHALRSVALRDGRLDSTAPERADVHVLHERSCVRCGSTTSTQWESFRPLRAGAPFYLQSSVPVLLEASAQHKEPKGKPRLGKRTLTFTDSRQGSASFALRLQLESERDYVRSWLWHKLVPKAVAPEEAKKLEGRLQLMRANPGFFSPDEVRKVEATLSGASQPSISWENAVRDLSNESIVQHVIAPSWNSRYRQAFTSEQVASTLVMRELMRRPARANSAETMGLVALDYDGLNRDSGSRRALGLTADDWRAFLRSILDHHFRGRWILVLPTTVQAHWLGLTPRSYVQVAPKEPRDKRKQVGWPGRHPQTGRWNALVLLLARAVDLAPEDPLVQDAVLDAWDAIRPILTAGQEGYSFDLAARSSIVAVSKAWLCPVSRRVLPYVVAGWSRYVPEGNRFGRCTEVEMPRLAFPFGKTEAGLSISDAERTKWLENDVQIQQARSLGIWSDLHDRLTAAPDVVLAAEHSAQQSPGALARYTEEFKAGRLNVLSCSTTMEMGVDIGGLSTVAMNNVPPHPANFFQRAGRAGRRGESAAASLTMCKAVPHGEAVFRDPLWAWKTAIAPPKVSLTSEPIIRRHLAALALSRFWRGTEMLKLTSESFFAQPSLENPHVASFKAWLGRSESAESLASALALLVRRTPLSGKSAAQLLDLVALDLQRVWDSWKVEYEASSREIKEQEDLAKSEGTTKSPALTVARAVQRRLLCEYLLRDLSQRCFLPVHGFPTGIAQMVTANIASVKKDEENDGEQSVENFRAFPSRDLPMAIREYAPGATVTLDGKVYRPKGVTLNWHMPVSEAQARETQEFKHIWKCAQCGAGGVRSLKPDSCLECGHAPVSTTQFLQPAGFAVDFFDDISNDESDRVYLPVRPPRPQGNGPWLDLAAPDLGRLRVTEEAQVVHLNHGTHGYGYAICLSCGRAAAELNPDTHPDSRVVPQELKDHYRLRGGKQKTATGKCHGNERPFLIKRRQALGAVVPTTLFEVALNPAEGEAPNMAGLRALAIALRQAAAQRLGIETREIGWAVRRGDADSKGPTIALFDTAVGGAGYVSQLPDHLELLLRRASEILRCPLGCDRACHACLLSFDTQHDIDKVDRKLGLSILSDDFLSRLKPGPELEALLGSGSTFEARPLREALDSIVSRGGTKAVRVALGGENAEWDLPNWTLRDDLLAWAAERVAVTLIIDPADLAKVGPETRENLRALMQAAQISLVAAPALVGTPARRRPTIELERSGESYEFAMSQPAAAVPGSEWGFGARVMRMRRISALPALGGRKVSPDELAPKPTENVTALPRPAVGVDIIQAATLLLNALLNVAPEAKARIDAGTAIEGITYDDRYLQSAVGFRFALEFARAIAREQKPRTTFRAADKSGFAASGFRTTDKDVPSKLLAAAGTNALRSVLGKDSAMLMVDRAVLGHQRSLKVTWSDKKQWRIDFDGGIGHELRCPSNLTRLEAFSLDDVARRLATASFVLNVEPSRLPPPIYIWKLT